MSAPLDQIQIRFTPVVTGLSKPIGITNSGNGDNRLFVLEKGGLVRVIENGTLLATPFLDLSNQVSQGGEQGLLGIAFPPGYGSKGYFYVNYTNLAGDTVIARYRLGSNANQADPLSEEVILQIDQPFPNHNGGQLAFGADGYLYIGMGDGGGGGDPQNNAQNPATLLGKILRIDVESGTKPYAIPTSNPFQSSTDGYRDEIWAIGLRNPWRFSFDRQTGDLYIGDVGQNHFEEINVQPASSQGGENYGWRIREGTLPFYGSGLASKGFTSPITGYDHSQGASVTGGFVYRGTTPSDLQGVYLYGDFANGRIWGLRRNGTLWESKLLLDTDFTIAAFGEDSTGNLYIADYSKGTIYQLNPPPQSTLTSPVSPITAGDDSLTGTDGADRIRGLAGNDTLIGLGSRDRLIGSQGNDTLFGESGNDILDGSKGRDRLWGGEGSDRLIGGKGRDIFTLELGYGRDRFVDFEVGRDRLGLSSELSFNQLKLTQRENGTLIQVGRNALAFLENIQVKQIDRNSFLL
jgi:glucose/arabinose dehydrogenase